MHSEASVPSFSAELHYIEAVAALLHETQLERGATSVYLTSQGTTFNEEVAGIRMMTDERLAELLESDRAVAFRNRQGIELARELPTVRLSVDCGAISSADVINYFAGLNLAFLDTVDALICDAPSAGLRTSLVGHLALMRAKELTGMERVVISRAIGEGHLDQGTNLSVVSLLAAQESLLRIFDQATSDRIRTQMAQLATHPVVEQCSEMEMAVLRNGVGASDIELADWFLASTQRIDLMRQVERRNLREIHHAELEAAATDSDSELEEALAGARKAMREIHGLLKRIESGDASLRQLVRGEETALDRAGFELAAAQRTAQAMAHQATTNPVTGLANRSVTSDLIAAALDRCADAKPTIALLMIDVDHFKTFNDSLGHTAGDTILRHVATRLRGSLRSGDTVVHMGGDEFLVVAEPIEDEFDAVKLARRLLTEIGEPIVIGRHRLQISLSIGVAVADESVPDANTLIGNSDLALHRAKAEGRGRVALFDDTLRGEAEARHEVGQGLRSALERGEIVPWYQPIVDLETGYPIAIEALARWVGPDGVRPASEWIDAAEAEGLLPALSERMIDVALRQSVQIGSARPAISINVVAANLITPDFATWVLDVLDAGDLTPHDVWIEITEQTAVDDSRATDILHELRAAGCSIALDDFGTGFSALASLRDLPIDIVKLDRGFLAGLTEDRQTRAILSSVTDVIRTLGLRSVAEGVETTDELDILRQLEVDMAQGFVICRPTPDPSTLLWPGTPTEASHRAA